MYLRRSVFASLATAVTTAVSLTASSGDFVLLEVPGFTQTIPSGVNDRGDVVGSAIRCSVDPGTGDLAFESRGFLYKNGEYGIVEMPGAVNGPTLTDINASGSIVGYFTASDGVHGFTLHRGRMEPLSSAADPDLALVPQGINARGDIVGWIPPTGGEGYRAFVMEEGDVSILSVPSGSIALQAWGINASGVVVGSGFSSTLGTFSFGYRDGQLATVPLAGSLIDVNDRGDLLAEIPGGVPPSVIYRKASGWTAELAAGEYQVTDIANRWLVGLAPQLTLPNGCAQSFGFALRWN